MRQQSDDSAGNEIAPDISGIRQQPEGRPTLASSTEGNEIILDGAGESVNDA